MRFCENSFVWVPAEFNSTFNCSRRDSALCRPFWRSKRFVADGQYSIIALIASLLRFCRPSHVAGFIVAVVVWITIQRVCGAWPWSYILKKRFKTMLPFRTNGYSPASITVKIWTFFVEATSLHMFPSLVFRITDRTVFMVAGACHFFLQTSAAFCMPVAQFTSNGGRHLPASTPAQPASFSFNDVGESDNSE